MHQGEYKYASAGPELCLAIEFLLLPKGTKKDGQKKANVFSDHYERKGKPFFFTCKQSRLFFINFLVFLSLTRPFLYEIRDFRDKTKEPPK